MYVWLAFSTKKQLENKKQTVRFARDTEIDVPQDADSTRNSDNKTGNLNIR